MQRKALAAAIEWKADKPGAFRATFATLGVVDHDKDVTLPGAFKNGQQVVISAYQHMSWQGALPVGAGVIGSDSSKAWVDGEFFMNTSAGADTYKTVKALADKGLGEWSYGYEPLKASQDQEDLNAYPGAMRILKEQDVFEVSPVLKGAGIGTTTESIKSLSRRQKLAARMKEVTVSDSGALNLLAQVDAQADALDDAIEALMSMLGVDDPDEDNGENAEPDGDRPANLPRNSSVTLTEAAPLVPALQAPATLEALLSSPSVFVQLPKGMRYQDHGNLALAAISLFAARTKTLASMRAKEGRTLSAANRDRLAALQGAIASASTDLAELLSSTDLSNDGKSANAELQKIFLDVQRRQAELVEVTEG